MNVSIIGAGYVGLVSGACFAELGHDVTLVDVDESRVDRINARVSPLHEPGLEDLLKRNVPQRLRATKNLVEAVVDSDITLVAVPTPFDSASGRIDLRFVLQAAEQIGVALSKKDAYHVVVVKSTVVPGSTDTHVSAVLERSSGKRVGAQIGLGVCPEFLSEGTAVADFMQPDRIVIGGDDAQVIGQLMSLHAVFGGVATLCVNCRTAEMIKYASNTLLATAISFANEMAVICEAVGDVDVVDVMRGVHLSRYMHAPAPDQPARLSKFLMAGCGFGGSCLPKDTAALAAHGKAHGVETPLLDAALRVNRAQAVRTVDLVAGHLPTLVNQSIAVLGTAFKPGTADLRQSPAEPIIDELISRGAKVRTFDPAANDDTRRHFGGRVEVCDSMERAIDGVSAIVVTTAWPQFASLPAALRGRAPQPLVVDGRRMFNPADFSEYRAIGRRENAVSSGEKMP